MQTYKNENKNQESKKSPDLSFDFRWGGRSIHYNGIELIDLSYECDEYNEVFLDYLALFTSSFIIPTKTANISEISFVNLIKGVFQAQFQNNLYYNSDFNDKDLQGLFDLVYIIDSQGEQIFDCFDYDDKRKHNLFAKKLEQLDSKYVNNNINIPVCTLLKYLEHRSSIDSDIMLGGLNYGLKHLNTYTNRINDSYYNINISHFIKHSEDLNEFTRVLRSILLITKLLKLIITKNIELLDINKHTQLEFFTKLLNFNKALSPKKQVKTEAKIAFSGFARYNLKDIVEHLQIYKQEHEPEEERILKSSSLIKAELNGFLTNRFDTIIFQLENGIKVLDTIKIPCYKNNTLVDKIKHYMHDFVFRVLQHLKLYITFLKLI